MRKQKWRNYEMLIKLFGVPGAGKTTKCVAIIKHLIGHTFIEENDFLKDSFGKYTLDEICFTTFTKAGIQSIREKMVASGFEEKEMPYFKTLNSLTWSLAGFNRSHILTHSEKEAFFKSIHISTRNLDDPEHTEMREVESFHDFIVSTLFQRPKDMTLPNLINIARDYELKRIVSLTPDTLARASKLYSEFCEEKGKFPHAESLLKTFQNKKSIEKPVLIVDEAQDLSCLQTEIVNIWESDAEVLLLAGDDDQTVHEWNGATPEYFLSYERPKTYKIIMEKSYRIPANVAKLCNSLITKVEKRETKNMYSEKEDSEIKHFRADEKLAVFELLEKIQKANETVYLLFRTGKMKRRMEGLIFNQTPVVFGSVNSSNDKRYSYYNKEFYIISNALNKIEQNIPLTRDEVAVLFSKLKSAECLVKGAKKKIEELSKPLWEVDEVLRMTKRWKRKDNMTLDSFTTHHLNKSIKGGIIDFLHFSKNAQKTPAVIARETDLQNKLRAIDYFFPEDSDLLVKTGTFHSCKGLEADNVIVFLGTSGFFSEINDSEIRCLYTACSRTLNKLYFVGTDTWNKERTELQQFYNNATMQQRQP